MVSQICMKNCDLTFTLGCLMQKQIFIRFAIKIKFLTNIFFYRLSSDKPAQRTREKFHVHSLPKPRLLHVLTRSEKKRRLTSAQTTVLDLKLA
jgi:hypothetical protein